MFKLFSALAILALITPIATARIINIPEDYSTIQAGINASLDRDTVLVQPGTYHERVNFNGHCIFLGSLYIIDADTSHISSTIIDGDSAGSVISVRNCGSNESAIIGLTIKHGSAPMGGGINLNYANPLISSNRISECETENYGGGIYCLGSSPIIIGNIISNCYAYY